MLFTSWGEAISTEDTNEFLQKIASCHLSDIPSDDTNRKYLANCLTSGDLRAVCDHGFDYGVTSTATAADLVQVQAFFKKREDLDFGIDREAVAFSKFMESNDKCRETNRLFRAWSQGRLQFPPRFERILHLAQRKIAGVLGEPPSFEDIKCRFGPGATTQIPKRMACAKVKLSQPLACSEDMVPVLKDALASLPHLVGGDSDFDDVLATVLIHTGELAFVRKNYKTDRIVDPPPWLNGIYQVGLGDYIAEKLRSVGIDTRDQTRNQRLAFLGSLTGALATLDLSSASDLEASALVYHLLGHDWYGLLDSLRVGTTTHKGKPIHLEMFSTMGNGYTFSLMTLILWGLVRAACDCNSDVVSVYGDDIICPSEKVGDVIYALETAGFIINHDKSYWVGPFRESCGADYLSGIDIRPCFIKKAMTGHDAFRLHNFYVRAGRFDIASIVREHISDDLAIYGPDGYGDGHLIGEWTSKPYKRDLGYGGFLFDTYTYKKREFKTALAGDRVLPAYSIYLAHPEEDEEGTVMQALLSQERKFRQALIQQDPDDPPPLFPYSGTGMRFTKKGTPVNYLPGVRGYQRISIYTLTDR